MCGSRSDIGLRNIAGGRESICVVGACWKRCGGFFVLRRLAVTMEIGVGRGGGIRRLRSKNKKKKKKERKRSQSEARQR